MYTELKKRIKNERVKYCVTGDIMRFAYDTFLQSIVSSDLAAQNSSDEQYRYECACCGEEVIIAARYSDNMVAHFRHRSGNNDVDCENYLGKYGLISARSETRESEREKVEFYFNNGTKCFYIGLRFNEDELSNYEKEGTCLEIRSRKDADPFFSKRIDSSNFSPDYAKMVMLETFSPVYFISNSFNPNKKPYMAFHENSPSFFKIQGEEKEFNAKLVRSDALYTGVRYFVALVGGNGAQLKLRKLQGIDIEQEFDFMSMRNRIWASVITITNKTTEIETAFEQWNYKIDTPENLTLLWPPSYEIDGVNCVSSKDAFLYSSFRLQPRGNINTEARDIQEITSNITKVKIDKHIKILRKNAEIEIKARNLNLSLNESIVKEQITARFSVPRENRYYLFSDSGIRELKYGEEIVLSRNSYICGYSNNCLIEVIKAVVDAELTGEELFIDVIKHYKVFELYTSVCTDGKPAFIVNYINDCKKIGKINSLVKKYIEEGKL